MNLRKSEMEYVKIVHSHHGQEKINRIMISIEDGKGAGLLRKIKPVLEGALDGINGELEENHRRMKQKELNK